MLLPILAVDENLHFTHTRKPGWMTTPLGTEVGLLK